VNIVQVDHTRKHLPSEIVCNTRNCKSDQHNCELWHL